MLAVTPYRIGTRRKPLIFPRVAPDGRAHLGSVTLCAFSLFLFLSLLRSSTFTRTVASSLPLTSYKRSSNGRSHQWAFRRSNPGTGPRTRPVRSQGDAISFISRPLIGPVGMV
ncbi:hypothetical protein FA13DRAFT_1303344 [Coprinellus micaceus]|uniref:Uncharacterized protein n=1 Tax=Coprinellus micaceus TaxID=71717 RepID=A0A4Y7SRN5_COPMI|nr:hypothetical protein FA13DRAFT_1303344 [Coprinellus micaceus]